MAPLDTANGMISSSLRHSPLRKGSSRYFFVVAVILCFIIPLRLLSISISSQDIAIASIGFLPSSTTTSTTAPAVVRDAHPDAPWPRIAWLMSFPNSGTTYTSHLVYVATNTTTASNYGVECDLTEERTNRPVLPSMKNGPWIKLFSLEVPETYVLTKTHCGGKCPNCPPAKYIETYRSFKRACLSGHERVNNERVLLTYPESIVQRAIHLIRNPFDNIVSRFHHERKMHKNDQEWTKRFPNSPSGFRKWCGDSDERSKESKSRWIDEDLEALWQPLVCRHEFYRYVQWHNLALQVTDNMMLPTMLLFYENYTTHFDETVEELFDFVKIDTVADPPEFITGKEYNEYFSDKERRVGKKVVRELATTELWRLLEHYFVHL